MSILDFPRLNFNGIFKTNPCTANNDDVEPSVVTRDTNDLGPDLEGKIDDEVTQYLGTAVQMNNYNDPPGTPTKTFIQAGWNPYGDHITTFEQTSISSVVYGPLITSPSNPPAIASATSAATDILVGASLEIIGKLTPNGSKNSAPMIVDLDPTGLVTTQLFVGGIRLTINDGTGNTKPIEIRYDTRAYQNWLNFYSTVPVPNASNQQGSYGGEQDFVGIACVWQFSIPASALPSYDSLGINSVGLKALLDNAQTAGGLSVRFRSYEMEPGYTDDYLKEQIEDGQFPANPAYGYLVGTIGIWNADEPQTEPAGRKLEATYSSVNPQKFCSPNPGRPDMNWSIGPDTPPPIQTPPGPTNPGCPYPWMGPPALIGNVVVKVSQNPAIISLDIIETFPKLGFRNPNGPQTNNPPEGFDQPKQMAYVGEVELAVIPAGGGDADAIPIANIDYGFGNYSKYENWGGIVDVIYDASLYPKIAAGQLILRGKSPAIPEAINAGVTLVKETLIRVVTDDRTAYLAFDNAPYPINVKVYERGGPTTVDVTLYLNEYKNIVQLKPDTTDQCSSPDSNKYRTNQSVGSRTDAFTTPPTCPPEDNLPEPSRLLFPQSVTIPAGTTSWTPVMISPNQASGGGAAVLALQTEQDYLYGTIPPSEEGGQYTVSVAGVPMWSNATYSSVRVYEEEDFSSLYNEQGELQWSDVYKNALRYYALIFPAMSALIPLNSSSAVGTIYANSILQRLNVPGDPLFLTTLNMPVTRTLSPPRVKLIRDFIAQQNKQQ